MADEESTGAVAQPAYDARDTFPTVLAETHPAEEGNKGPTEPDKKEPTAFILKDAPEFKEITDKLTKAEERAIRAEERANALMSRGPERQPETREEKLDFEDLSALNAEELRERWDKDPHAVLGNLLRQARHEVRQDIMGEVSHRTTRERQNSGLQAFVKDNPEFIQAYQSGALNDIIEGNPIHSPVSAFLHRAYTDLKANSVSKADHEKAVKDAEAKGFEAGRKDAKIHDGARVLGPGPAKNPATYQSDKKIKSEDYGGDPTQALLARHRARKEAMGG